MKSSRSKKTFFEHYKKEGNNIMLSFESLPDVPTKI
jgi:hypothetical protein